jgi:hypothetical protein
VRGLRPRPAHPVLFTGAVTATLAPADGTGAGGSGVQAATPRAVAAALAAVVGAGAVLRLWDLGAFRLSYDESFTAVAGRLPVGRMFGFLRVHDSHPPLDYLLHLPLARAGVAEVWFRLPSALLSIGALALFAWWMRGRGRVAVIATALLAFSAFQVAHGREARMYAELELWGVATAVLASAWLRRPRRRHAIVLTALVLSGLLLHVSMFLLAIGLLALPGLRRDADAWRWRAAIAVAVAGWAVLWGPTFLVQARGGHSGWIPPTSLATLTTAVGHLVTVSPGLVPIGAAATVAGGFVIARRDTALARVWVCACALPIAVAAVAGLFEPVVLDRTFTLMSWGACVAVAYLLDAVVARRRLLGTAAACGAVAVATLPTFSLVETPTGPDLPIRILAADLRPGDVVAVRPASKAPELEWSLGVRGRWPTRVTRVPDIPDAFGLRAGTARPTGRVWLLDWRRFRSPQLAASADCSRRWQWGRSDIRCLQVESAIAATTGARISGEVAKFRRTCCSQPAPKSAPALSATRPRSRKHRGGSSRPSAAQSSQARNVASGST